MVLPSSAPGSEPAKLTCPLFDPRPLEDVTDVRMERAGPLLTLVRDEATSAKSCTVGRRPGDIFERAPAR
jgi:hypothetical protein